MRRKQQAHTQRTAWAQLTHRQQQGRGGSLPTLSRPASPLALPGVLSAGRAASPGAAPAAAAAAEGGMEAAASPSLWPDRDGSGRGACCTCCT